jgi:hypothetical protein
MLIFKVWLYIELENCRRIYIKNWRITDAKGKMYYIIRR